MDGFLEKRMDELQRAREEAIVRESSGVVKRGRVAHHESGAAHLKRIKVDAPWLQVILAGARSRAINTAVCAGRLTTGLEVRGSAVGPWLLNLDSIGCF